MKKNIIILGSTGSIGTSTINLIKKDKNKFSIKLLSTHTNIKKVYNQAKLFKVKNVIISDKKSYERAKKLYRKSNIKFHNSFFIIDNLFKKKEIFFSMVSIVGLDGLDPSLKLVKYCQNIAIINKESLICGWNLISKELKKYKTKFFPVDSEHFSIFSLIDNQPNKIIDQIFLTASGGPFLNYTHSKLSDVKIAQVLKHPTWNMGKKISVDSSTMMNKLFEVIEAKKIFNIPYKKINILIHPKSYVHALVRFNNGITKILVHDPDMKIPIHNSLYYKKNMQFKTKSLNFKILNNLDFKSVNYKKFPLLKLLNNLPKNDSLYETVLVTINDFFVSIYLNKKIDYKRLVHLIYSYSNNKIFLKFKKKIPKNVNEIYKTKNFVYTKLNNWGI
tara:strand:- start:73 stop:1239 length:1167 start_codon:yes stop_codon:yes gene_type:complete